MTRRYRVYPNKPEKTRNYRTPVNISVLSSQSIRILNKFWKNICNHKRNLSLPIQTSLTATHISQIKKNDMYNHIPNDIRREFESFSQHHGIKCEIKLARDRTAIIYIATNREEPREKYDIYLNNIIAWLNFVSEIASPDCSNTLHIYFLFTDAKKTTPDIDTEPIDTVHANTAFTTSCSLANTIFIFRREEWFKVFMHETFHSFGLDFSAHSQTESNQRILSIFPAINKQTDIRLFETYCEMWAEIFNLMFSLFTTKTGKCNTFSTSRYIHALKREQEFSVYQSNKILKLANYQYKDMFVVSQTVPPYVEKTQAFSYYVIKSIILWNVDMFIKWCVHHSENSEIQFNPTNIADYCELVEDLIENDRNYKKIIERMNRTKKTFGLPENTLRMTSVEPEWSI